jgi:hypothetical protein
MFYRRILIDFGSIEGRRESVSDLDAVWQSVAAVAIQIAVAAAFEIGSVYLTKRILALDLCKCGVYALMLMTLAPIAENPERAGARPAPTRSVGASHARDTELIPESEHSCHLRVLVSVARRGVFVSTIFNLFSDENALDTH